MQECSKVLGLFTAVLNYLLKIILLHVTNQHQVMYYSVILCSTRLYFHLIHNIQFLLITSNYSSKHQPLPNDCLIQQYKKMRKRQIKKTVITYEDQSKPASPANQRSREKPVKVEVVDMSSRRARLAQLRNQEQEEVSSIDPVIQVTSNLTRHNQEIKRDFEQSNRQGQGHGKIGGNQGNVKKEHQRVQDIQQQDNFSQNSNELAGAPILKPVFLGKQDRHIANTAQQHEQQAQRKKKALKYTTKLLLLENEKENEEDEEIEHSSDEDDLDNRTDVPNDCDTKDEELEYELWKIRELKRVRRDRQERRKIMLEKVEIERRRKMNNEQILLENKVMGSDATDNTTETKYVFMQKYYHKGAFYQDSQDPIFKRDYNLPTPLEMQDKSMLPEILQRRAGNFGKKGQSKYKHLTAEDTTNFDPAYRQDEAILNNWKKKMAGHKGSYGANI